MEQGGWITWPGSAMRPSAVKLAIDHVATYRPSLIVELGGGVSTRLLARFIALEGLDSKVLTIDADADWCKTLEGMVQVDGNGNFVNIVHAPLCRHAAGGASRTVNWFDETVVGAAIDDSLASTSAKGIDLLIVDGPTAQGKDNRYNRLPAYTLHDRLSESATVLIDDAWRAGELFLQKEWSRIHGAEFRMRHLDSMAIARLDGKWWI